MKPIIEWQMRAVAEKQLQKLPSSVQKVIIRKLDLYIGSGNPLSFAKRLTNYEVGDYRFRIDKDYRVVFDVVGTKIVILQIGHRREIYK